MGRAVCGSDVIRLFVIGFTQAMVIHPFEESIWTQYQNVREKIFDKAYPGMDVLPKFDLQTIKAVQTISGNRDSQFQTWFEALSWMEEECRKREFDIAIIGCGAYGFPLAASVKRMGKIAVHLGGSTQILFGILGRRWERQKMTPYMRKVLNRKSLKAYAHAFESVHSHTLSSWAYQLQYQIFSEETLAVIPNRSMVCNIGFGEESTHTKEKPAGVVIDQACEMKFPLRHPDKVIRDKAYDKEFVNAQWPFDPVRAVKILLGMNPDVSILKKLRKGVK